MVFIVKSSHQYQDFCLLTTQKSEDNGRFAGALSLTCITAASAAEAESVRCINPSIALVVVRHTLIHWTSSVDEIPGDVGCFARWVISNTQESCKARADVRLFVCSTQISELACIIPLHVHDNLLRFEERHQHTPINPHKPN